jgi:hypothetical protein
VPDAGNPVQLLIDLHLICIPLAYAFPNIFEPTRASAGVIELIERWPR